MSASIDPQPEEQQFLDLIAIVLANFRRHVIALAISTILFAIAGIVSVLMMPSIYEADIEVAPQSTSSGGILNAVAGGQISALLGSKSSNPAIPLMESMLRSRSLALEMIRLYHFDSVWFKQDYKKARWETQVRQWNDAFSYEVTDYSTLRILFQDKDSIRCAAVVKSISLWIDSSYMAYQRGQAQMNEEFLNRRLKERQILLANAEDSLLKFQLANNAFLPSAQLEATARKTAMDQVELEKINLQIDVERGTSGSGGSNLRALELLRNSKSASVQEAFDTSRGIKQLAKNSPNLASLTRLNLQFARLIRQVEIHGKVYAFLVQQREQFALDASRDIPSLTIIDAVKVPEKRSRPPRGTLVMSITFFGFLGTWAFLAIRPSIRNLGMRVKELTREAQ